MILMDVNVLIYAHRQDTENHSHYQTWLKKILKGPSNFGLTELVLSSFLRIVTHTRIFVTPTPLTVAFQFITQLKNAPNCVIIQPGSRHWGIFKDLCLHCQAKGNLITDAYLAALAIESGCEWMTTDRDYSRFPNLKWRHPLDEKK